MAQYADGFVIVMKKDGIEDYKKVASKAGKVWMDHGAISYYETTLEDDNAHHGKPFSKLTRAREDETVIFSWIVFKSRAHRDKVNAAVMADKRMAAMMEAMKQQPDLMDMKRFSYGGFDVIVKK